MSGKQAKAARRAARQASDPSRGTRVERKELNRRQHQVRLREAREAKQREIDLFNSLSPEEQAQVIQERKKRERSTADRLNHLMAMAAALGR